MKTPIAKKWDEKAEIYSKMASSRDADAFEYEINFPSLQKLLPKGDYSVLDLGCGDGWFTDILFSMYGKVLGADASPSMIEIAKRNFPQIEFALTDLDSEFPEYMIKYDIVVMKLVLMFVEDLDNVAIQVSKIVSKNGYVIISVPHPIYWTSYYLQDKYKVKERKNFRVLENGYFSEKAIEKSIGGEESLTFGFMHRTISSYVNTFAKHGFYVDQIDEPRLSVEYLHAHPEDTDKKDIPMRLNIGFRKVGL